MYCHIQSHGQNIDLGFFFEVVDYRFDVILHERNNYYLKYKIQHDGITSMLKLINSFDFSWFSKLIR